jgi:hypothetical protein
LKPVLVASALAVAAFPAHAALVVSQAPTSKVQCASGVCTATAANAVLNIADLKHLLATGDATVASGSKAMDIQFDAELQWTKPSRLTLDAYRGIAVGFAVTSEGTGGVTLTTNDGGSGGDLVFTGKGKVSFWDNSSSLVVNGTAYTLVGSIASLASAVAADPNGAFALAKSFDAAGDGVYKAAPVPGAFAGTFEGLGHTIDKLKLAPSGPAYGLFESIDTAGVVRDVTLANARMAVKPSAGGFLGLLVGTNLGTISRVSVVDGSVTTSGPQALGGLAGENEGTISWCAVSGSVLDSNELALAGGLVGMNSGTIVHARSSAAVQGNWAGGLAYWNYGTITLSSATGAVSANGRRKGHPVIAGFVPNNLGVIDQSFATGAVDAGSGERRLGVFANAAGFVSESSGTITNSYSTGSVTAGVRAFAAGFAGDTDQGGVIRRSYSSGAVLKNGRLGSQAGFVGGTANGHDNYWDTDTSGAATGCGGDCSGVTGLTTAQFQSGLPKGFHPNIWAENPAINNGLPYLIANPPQ